MPTIDVSYRDLCKLLKKSITVNEIENAVLFAKSELEEVNGDVLKIDVKDTNRPDLWSVEGIAREINGRYGNPGLPIYSVKKSGITINVDKKVSKIRPKTVAAVVKNLKITEEVLAQIIQLQEKIALTFGRNRKEVAVGVYDLTRISSPINYTTVKPNDIKFMPLDFEEELTPKQILDQHPKGKEFAHLLEGYKEYPIFIDSKNQVLSMPPIINSNYTGKVTESTKDLFIECSGHQLKFLIPALNSFVAALADRGGQIQSVDILYPERVTTPDLKPKKYQIDIDYVNQVTGLGLKPNEIVSLLRKSRLDANVVNNKINVIYPAYRQDIMHPRDIVEDVLISYDYNKIQPEPPQLVTIGQESKLGKVTDSLSSIMTGLGLQEVLSYVLTNKDNLFSKMQLPESGVCEIKNPVSLNWNVFRNYITPSLLDFLSKNKHVDYPHKVFEIGDCVILNKKSETRTTNSRKLSAAITDNNINYETIASVLEALMSNLGIGYNLKPINHPSFLKGRVAEVFVNNKSVGIIGELHPQVLNNWNIERPVTVFEIDIKFLV